MKRAQNSSFTLPGIEWTKQTHIFWIRRLIICDFYKPRVQRDGTNALHVWDPASNPNIDDLPKTTRYDTKNKCDNSFIFQVTNLKWAHYIIILFSQEKTFFFVLLISGTECWFWRRKKMHYSRSYSLYC